MSEKETKDNHGTSNHGIKGIRPSCKKMEGKAAAVPLHIKLININGCLLKENAKSAEIPARLSYNEGRFSFFLKNA